MRTLLSLMAALAVVVQIPTLAALAGTKRVLLIFAPSAQEDRFMRQGRTLAESKAELEERDVFVLRQLGTDATAEQATLRQRFHIVATDFTVILIGKDGGEKLRQHVPIEAAALNSIIDAMPMRRDEMRKQEQR